MFLIFNEYKQISSKDVDYKYLITCSLLSFAWAFERKRVVAM